MPTPKLVANTSGNDVSRCIDHPDVPRGPSDRHFDFEILGNLENHDLGACTVKGRDFRPRELILGVCMVTDRRTALKVEAPRRRTDAKNRRKHFGKRRFPMDIPFRLSERPLRASFRFSKFWKSRKSRFGRFHTHCTVKGRLVN